MNPFDYGVVLQPVTLYSLLINLGIGAFLAIVLSWHYVHFGTAFTNRAVLARVFIILIMATTFTISMVRSSIVLALGLFGGLSIIRFRTPVKEPEELAYIFLCIAIGLALGADQWWLTMVGVAFILVVLAVRSMLVKGGPGQNLYVCIDIPLDQNQESVIRSIQDTLARYVKVVDIRRVDLRDGMLQTTFYVDCTDKNQILDGIEALRQMYQDAAISFIEQQSNLGA